MGEINIPSIFSLILLPYYYTLFYIYEPIYIINRIFHKFLVQHIANGYLNFTGILILSLVVIASNKPGKP
jgi:hypothetical protein